VFLIEDQGDNKSGESIDNLTSQDEEIEPTISFKQISESFVHHDTVNTTEEDENNIILNRTVEYQEQGIPQSSLPENEYPKEDHPLSPAKK
jgi:hypothetical protein